MHNIDTIFLFFVIYSFLGWLLEVLYAYSNSKCFVNRGFLHGPFCPIYGFGVIIILLCLKPFENNLLTLFIMSIILTSSLEYITGLCLEKFFNQKWWDYSADKFNLHGRICLLFSIVWGIICVFIVKIFQPLLSMLISFIPKPLIIAFSILFFIYFLIDGIFTIKKLNLPCFNIEFRFPFK